MWLELALGLALTFAGVALTLYIAWPHIRGFRREAVALAALICLAMATALYVHVASIEQAGVVEYEAQVVVPWYNGTWQGSRVVNATVKVPVYRTRSLGALGLLPLAVLMVAGLLLMGTWIYRWTRSAVRYSYRVR